MPETIAVKNVLVSVSDRSGLAELCKGLVAAGARIVATDSTGRHLAEHGIATTPVAEVTGFPEMLGGRVKTLHPRIHGGILADRDDPSHMAQLADAGIEPIDLIVVNLYPFRDAVAKGLPAPEIVEQIDIGGPSLIRAAAKNHTGVGIVVDPGSYASVLEEVKTTGVLSLATRRALAAKAFAHTAAYDAAISRWMSREEMFPEAVSVALERLQSLRYGENPHQAGALYGEVGKTSGVARAKQLHGKEMSFTNFIDLDAAWAAATDFADPACAIIKHATPCGIAIGPDVVTAYERALECDKVSAYGGVVAVNRPLTRAMAERIAEIFTEVVAAPSYEPEALTVLEGKKNMRLLVVEDAGVQLLMRGISGGVLLEEPDVSADDRSAMRVVTKTQPTEEQWRDLLFAMRACKHVRSNGIVFARDGALVGIGGGQTSRVDSVDIAAKKAGDRAKGAVMASDAFFPFRDGFDAGAAAGIAAVIEPGGSVRDDEVIAAADEQGIAMVFTGKRHFRHG